MTITINHDHPTDGEPRSYGWVCEDCDARPIVFSRYGTDGRPRWHHVDIEVDEDHDPKIGPTDFILNSTAASLWQRDCDLTEAKTVITQLQRERDQLRQDMEKLNELLAQARDENESAAALANAQQEIDALQSSNQSLRDRQTQLMSERDIAQSRLYSFKEEVVSTVVDWDGGCKDGKKQFLGELGLEWPSKTFKVEIEVVTTEDEDEVESWAESLSYNDGEIENVYVYEQ